MREFLKNLHQRPIAYYPVYRQITGSTTAGVLLSQLMYWFSKQDRFHKTDAEIMAETLLTKKELELAKKSIKKLSFIEVTRDGVPARTFYEISWESWETSLRELGKQDSPKGGNCAPRKGETINDVSLTETTTETTTESKKEPIGSKKEPDSKTFSFNLAKKTPISKLSKDYLKRLHAYAITRDAGSEWEAFLDHHTQHGKSMKDWAAAYRTWLRNVEKFGGELHRPIRGRGRNGVEIFVDIPRKHAVEADDAAYTLYTIGGGGRSPPTTHQGTPSVSATSSRGKKNAGALAATAVKKF
jgi:hypothetical protein